MSQAKPDSSYAPVPGLSVPAMVYPYKAGAIGGALGGFAMIVVAALYGLSSGHGLWLPVNLIGATIVRDLQAAPFEQLAQFNVTALLAGLLLHVALAIGLGFTFGLMLPTFPGHPLWWAVTVGPLMWVVASLLTLPLLNPVMDRYVDRPSFLIAHLVYSGVLGWWIGRTAKIQAD